MHENWIATHQLHENIVFGLTGCLKNQLLTNRMQKSAVQTTAGLYGKIILMKPNTLKMTSTRSTSVNNQHLYHHEPLKIDFGQTERMKNELRTNRILQNMVLGQTGYPK